LFEYRWHKDIIANQLIPYTQKPENPKVWRGESLLDKSIVIQMEQGFGDILMFA